MPWEISKDGTTMRYRPTPFTLREKEGARCPYRNPECPTCYPEIQRAEVNRAALIRAAVKNAALEQFPGTVAQLGFGGALAWHSGCGLGRTFCNAIRRHFFALMEATTNV